MDARALRDGLAHEDPEVRRRATAELGRVHAADACDLLVRALGDDDWRVRKEAAGQAARMEPRTAVVYALSRLLDERDNIGQRNSAVEALVHIGPDAVPGAIDALERLHADGRKLAVEVLAGAPTVGGVRALAQSLSDEDVNVRLAAAEALGRAGLAGEEGRDLATRALSAFLASERSDEQLAALVSLRALGGDVPFESVAPLLGEPLTRRDALAALAGTLAPRGLRALAEAVADAHPSTAGVAVRALGVSLERAWGDDELLEIVARPLAASSVARERLRELALPGDATARRGALLALALIRDPDDVELITDALADDDVLDFAEAALQSFGEDAVAPLLAAGRTAAPSIRGAAMSVLPQVSQRDDTSLEALREALRDPSIEVVVAALKSLAIVGRWTDLTAFASLTLAEDARVAAAAHAALSSAAAREHEAARSLVAGADPRGDSAGWAVTVLGALAREGLSAPQDGAFLAVALSHRSADVRRGALDALAEVGGDDAVEAVTFCLADEEPRVAHAAIRALGRLGRADDLARLAAQSKHPARLGAVLRALGDADPVRAFAAARPLLRSPDPQVASAAVHVVGGIDVDGRAEALRDATGHGDHEVVKLALDRLLAADAEAGLDALATALEHNAREVRRYAAEVLGLEGSAEAQSLLRARLDRERDGQVREAMMTALRAARVEGGG